MYGKGGKGGKNGKDGKDGNVSCVLLGLEGLKSSMYIIGLKKYCCGIIISDFVLNR